jgi:hypothetical protein
MWGNRSFFYKLLFIYGLDLIAILGAVSFEAVRYSRSITDFFVRFMPSQYIKMKTKLTRILQYCFATLLLVFFWSTDIAYARGGYGGATGGYSGGYGVRTGGYGGNGSFVSLTQKSFYSLLQSLAVLLLVLLPIAFYHEIANLMRFWNKKFTDDPELIEFIKSIHPRFTNTYSVKFFRNSEIWKVLPLSPALPEEEYQNFISKQVLSQGVCDLFIRYQQDWTQKNFELMTEYLNVPFYEQQSDRFRQAFRDGYDVVYHPKVNELAPLSYEFDDGSGFFRVQINAEMVNFSLLPRGSVLSGEPTLREFTEYWDIRVDSDRQFYLLGISLSNVDELFTIENLPAPQMSGLDRLGAKLVQLYYG